MPKDTERKAEGSEKPSVTYENIIEAYHGITDLIMSGDESVQHLTGETVGNPITLGPRVLSPEDWAKKQTERAVAASGDWLKQVKKPKKDPIDAAVAADDKRKDRLAEAEKQEKWKKAMGKVDKDLMYATIDKRGESSFKTGISDREVKVQARVKELQPLVTGVAATIDAMPEKTDADREKRLLAARKLMIELGKKRRGLS